MIMDERPDIEDQTIASAVENAVDHLAVNGMSQCPTCGEWPILTRWTDGSGSYMTHPQHKPGCPLRKDQP